MNNVFIPFHHISLLDSAGYVGDNLPAQEAMNNNNNVEEIVEEIINTVAKIEESIISSSASAKHK